MAGRPAAVGREKLQETFNSFKENIVELDCVVKPSAKIWTELHENYFPKLKPKAIYSAAIRWYKSVNEQSDSHESVSVPNDSSNISPLVDVRNRNVSYSRKIFL